MKCGNCGTEIKYGDKVCAGCGLPLPKSNYADFEPENKEKNKDVESGDKSKSRGSESDNVDDDNRFKSQKNTKKKDVKSQKKDEDILDFDESLFDFDDSLSDDKADVKSSSGNNTKYQKSDSSVNDRKSMKDPGPYEKRNEESDDPKDDKNHDVDDSDNFNDPDDFNDSDDFDDSDNFDNSNDKSVDGKKKKNSRKNAELVYSDDKLPEAEDVIDVDFVDVDVEVDVEDDGDGYKPPSTKVKVKHQWTKGDYITIIVGIALLVALIIAGIVWLVKKQNHKKIEDNKYGMEELQGFFDGISEKDEIISYDYVTGNNGDAIFKLVDERIKFASGFKNFEVTNIEVVEKKELLNSALDSMINKTGADLDKAYLLNITFRYNADDTVLPGKAIVRTGRTKKNNKWWVISLEFDDVLTAAMDYMKAYSKVDAEAIIAAYADGVLSDKDKESMRKAYQFIIAPYNFSDIRLKAFSISDGRFKEIAETFADKNKKFSSVVGFNVETYGMNSQNGSNRVDFELIMALDGNKWKVLCINMKQN